MGLFFAERKRKSKKRSISPAFLEKMGCTVCPRKGKNTVQPYGDKHPVIYILGDVPSLKAAETGKFIGGSALKLLEEALPSRVSVRYNCIARSPAVANSDRKTAETCCRKSIIADIEQSKPDIIIGLGHSVLPWVLPSQYNLDAWTGKTAPVRVGTHVCWFMPTYDPTFLIKQRKKSPWSKTLQPSKFEDQFMFDFRFLKKFLKTRRRPEVVDDDYLSGITVFMGEDASEVKDIKKELQSMKGSVGLDIETTGLSPYTYKEKVPRILTIAISTGEKTIAFPINHPRTHKLYRKRIQKQLYPMLASLGTKIAHNLSFELKWLATHCDEGVLEQAWDDTMLYSYLDDARKGTQSLDFNTVQHLGFSLKSQSAIDTTNCLGADLRELLLYNGLDAKYTKKLHSIVSADGADKTWMHKQRIEMAAAVTKISKRGMPASRAWYKKQITKFQKSSDALEQEIQRNKRVRQFNNTRKSPFNPQSDKDVLALFTEQLGFSLTSADEKSLLSTNTKLADVILAHRKEMKILGTYLEGWFVYLADDGSIHPDYNTMRTATSRLSSDSPNGQNSPKRQNKWCRNGIQAPEGYSLASIDYGQIEARTIGILSQDPAYVDAMWSNSDIHMEWAKILAEAHPAVVGGRRNLEDAEALKKWRTTVKNAWTFPLFFGAGIHTISRGTKIPKEVLEPIIKRFWRVFKASQTWQEQMHSLYKRNGYVETAMGFKRYGPLSHSEVLNTPIQGTAATLVNFGINALLAAGFPVIGTIHDSVEFCIRDDLLYDTLTRAAEIMLCAPLEEFDFICAPLVAEIEVGKKWGELEAWKEFSSTDFGHKRNKKFKRRT